MAVGAGAGFLFFFFTCFYIIFERVITGKRASVSSAHNQCFLSVKLIYDIEMIK